METKTQAKPALTIKSIMDREDVQSKIQKMMGKNTAGFVSSALQIVSNGLLAKADPMSVYAGIMTAASLDLSLNPAIGHAHLVPFNITNPDKSKTVKAVFIIGYLGLIELCQRSGQYKNISATPIFKGQLIESNPLTGFKFDFSKTSKEVIGYAAYIELVSGFQKTLYMTKQEVLDHAKKYSKTYGKSGSAWTTDEDKMCCKTVLRALLKYGPKSIDVQRAESIDEFIPDAAPDDSTFVDAVYTETNEEREKLVKEIEKANSAEELAVLKMQIGTDDYLDLQEAIDAKIEKINTKKK